jgi:hypothetical protein
LRGIRIVKGDTAFMGRTGPAVPQSCGCDVLPWEECVHSAWDRDLTLGAVIERQQEELTVYPDEPAPAPANTLPGLPPRLSSLLGRCRQMARWHAESRGKRGRLAKSLLLEIDAVVQEGKVS